MNQTLELDTQTRLTIAGLTALTGGITALAISELGGGIKNDLPESGFHLAAVVGAGVAGFLFADGMGRPGGRGALRAGLTAVLMTLIGAWLGAVLITSVQHPQVGVFGWIVLAEAAAEPLLLKIWAATMLVLHVKAGFLRDNQPLISP